MNSQTGLNQVAVFACCCAILYVFWMCVSNDFEKRETRWVTSWFERTTPRKETSYYEKSKRNLSKSHLPLFAVSFPSTSTEEKEIMKYLGFLYNKFRNEFYGRASREDLEKALQGSAYSIEELGE